MFDYNSFTHILCLNKTFYIIKDKEQFFENCALVLAPNGILIIHLLTRDKFKPFILPKDDTILYNPENHNNAITKNIIKFSSNLEYICEYEVLNSTTTTDSIDYFNQPYSCYQEKFENFDTHNIRKNLINLYIPTIDEILKLAKSKGFVIKDKKPLDFIGHNNEYLFIFKKIN